MCSYLWDTVQLGASLHHREGVAEGPPDLPQPDTAGIDQGSLGQANL